MDPAHSRVADGRTPELLQLAGSVPTPEDAIGLSWEEVRLRARDERAERLKIDGDGTIEPIEP